VGVNLETDASAGLVEPVDFGINRLPRRTPTGYQNQSMSVGGNGGSGENGSG